MTTRNGAAERASLPATLAWAGFAVLFLYAVLLGGSWLGIYVLPFRLASLGIIAVTLVGWAVVAWRHPAWRPRTSAWPLVVLPLGAFALAVAASRYPRLGLEYLAWGVLLVALYLLLVRILALPFARARIGALAAIVGLVIGIFYLAWVTLAWIEWWGLIGHFEVPPLRPLFAGLTYRNPSAVMTVVVLLTLIAYAGLGFDGRGRRVDARPAHGDRGRGRAGLREPRRLDRVGRGLRAGRRSVAPRRGSSRVGSVASWRTVASSGRSWRSASSAWSSRW